MSTLTNTPFDQLSSEQRYAMLQLARDIIQSVQQTRPVPQKQLDQLLARHSRPELLIRHLLKVYWPDITVTPKLLECFFQYYGITPRFSDN